MEISARTGVQRVRHEIHRREIVVSRIEQLAPNYVAVSFTGATLAGFLSLSFDDHLKFIVPGDGAASVMRDFTPRRFDPATGELTIEFALHEEGTASDWARSAAVGTAAAVAGPRGSMIIPTDYDWHLLVGDASALPAIRRRLDELPASAKVTVIASGDQNGALLPASTPARRIQRVANDAEMLAAVRALALPAGPGYSWCAGEAAAMKQLRDVLARDKGQPKEAMRVAAYWKNGVSSHHENLE
jgi:NADPH-dependent ferric siderophore reductase